MFSITANLYYGYNIIDLECKRGQFQCKISNGSEPKTSHFQAFEAALHDERAFILNEDIYGLPFIVHEDREQRYNEVHAALFLIDYYA